MRESGAVSRYLQLALFSGCHLLTLLEGNRDEGTASLPGPVLLGGEPCSRLSYISHYRQQFSLQ